MKNETLFVGVPDGANVGRHINENERYLVKPGLEVGTSKSKVVRYVLLASFVQDSISVVKAITQRLFTIGTVRGHHHEKVR